MTDRLYKYEVFPTREQAIALDFRFAAARSLYNEAVAYENDYARTARRRGPAGSAAVARFYAHSRDHAREPYARGPKEGQLKPASAQYVEAISDGVQGASFWWSDPEHPAREYPYALVPAGVLQGVLGLKGDFAKARAAIIKRRTQGKRASFGFRSRKDAQSITWQTQTSDSVKAVPSTLITWGGGKRAQLLIPNARGVKGGPGYFAGALAVAYHRPLPGDSRINAARIKRDLAGRYWLTLQVETAQVKQPASTGATGIDRGIADTAVLTDGRVLRTPSLTPGERRRLLRLEQSMARKRRQNPGLETKRYKKAKHAAATLHAKISFRAGDAEHKASRVIADEFAVVVLEDLGNLKTSGSAKGTVENPGKNVAAKAGLNREQRAQRWGKLEQRLREKTTVVMIPPAYTSQTCSACGHVSKDSRRRKVFTCVSCGVTMDADYNAAANILASGIAMHTGAAQALAARGDLCGASAQGMSVKRETLTSQRRRRRSQAGQGTQTDNGYGRSLVPDHWGISTARSKGSIRRSRPPKKASRRNGTRDS